MASLVSESQPAIASRFRSLQRRLSSFRTAKRVCNVCGDAEGCEQKMIID